MLRAILGVIVGYLVMAIAVFTVFAALVFGVGVERLLEPQTFNATMVLSIGTLIASFICALLGGWVCRAIAKRPGPVLVFACIVLAFGLISGVLNMNKPAAGPRDPSMPLLEALGNAREPVWYGFFLPFVGAAGVLVGGRGFKRL